MGEVKAELAGTAHPVLVLSPVQTGGPPSEHVRQSADNSIARQEQEPGETILYFPDYVDGDGWSVQLALSNVDPDVSTEVRVEVYDPDGQPVLDLFDSDLMLEIPALGSHVLRSAGSGAIRRGWIQVGADAPAMLEWFRLRWQVELVFKRFKSLAQLGHLPKHDEASAQAWLYGKLLVALLVEKVVRHARTISPWGYDVATGQDSQRVA